MSFGEGLNALTLLGILVMAVDRWIHKRENNETTLAGRVTRLEEGQERASRRSSEKESETMTKIMELELDMREVKTMLRRFNLIDGYDGR